MQNEKDQKQDEREETNPVTDAAASTGTDANQQQPGSAENSPNADADK